MLFQYGVSRLPIPASGAGPVGSCRPMLRIVNRLESRARRDGGRDEQREKETGQKVCKRNRDCE